MNVESYGGSDAVNFNEFKSGISGSSGSGLCVSFKPFVAFLFGFRRLTAYERFDFCARPVFELCNVWQSPTNKTRETCDSFTAGTRKSASCCWQRNMFFLKSPSVLASMFKPCEGDSFVIPSSNNSGQLCGNSLYVHVHFSVEIPGKQHFNTILWFAYLTCNWKRQLETGFESSSDHVQAVQFRACTVI